MRTYVNAQQSGVCAGNMTLSPSEMLTPTDMWIGKSGFVKDAYLTARLADFVVFSKTLA